MLLATPVAGIGSGQEKANIVRFCSCCHGCEEIIFSVGAGCDALVQRIFTAVVHVVGPNTAFFPGHIVPRVRLVEWASYYKD